MKITSPASLNVGTELTIDTAGKTFTLNVAGNLVAKDGCTIQALYSKFVALWATADYNEFPFPMYAIDALSGQFQFGTDGATYNGWKPANDATRQMLRDGGWSEYNAAGTLARQYVGIVSLGTVSSGSQLYYQKANGAASANFTFTDAVNEGIQVYGDVAADATTTTFDNRTYFKGFVREYSKKYKDSVLADTGKTGTGAYIVNMLLSNEDDLDIVANDATAGGATDPWQKIKLRYFASPFVKGVDSSTNGQERSFGIVLDVGTHSGIDGSGTSGTTAFSTAAGGMTAAYFNGGTLKIHNGPAKGTYSITSNTATGITLGSNLLGAASGASFTAYPAAAVSASLKQIYTWAQYKLRQNSDIDDTGGTVNGKTAGLLLNFVGPILKCGFYAPTNPNGGGSGVIVEGISNSDSNSITFYDNTGATREYPYSAAGSISFNPSLVGAGSYYRMYFTTNPAGNYGSATAVTVKDAAGADISGTIAGASIGFTYDYTNNVQGGRTGGTDAAVTIVAGRPGYAKPVVSTGTLTQSKTIALGATAETDRAYTS